MTKPKPKPRQTVVQRKVIEPPRQELTFRASTVKWLIGTLASLFLLYGGWKVVWSDIDNHWRQEVIQVAKDKETDAKVKALAQKAESGRAWLFWGLGDFKASNQKQWAAVCPALKQSPDVCAQWKADALQYQQEAADAKRDATNIGKETP
jgi:hypothetical protein